MNERERIRKYIWALTRKLGLTPTELAREAGVSPSTLTRFLNKDVEYMLSTSTLAKIAEAAGEPNSYLPVISARNTDSAVNMVLDALEAVEEFLKEEKISLPPHEKRNLVKTLYEVIAEDEITNPDKVSDFSEYKAFLKNALNN